MDRTNAVRGCGCHVGTSPVESWVVEEVGEPASRASLAARLANPPTSAVGDPLPRQPDADDVCGSGGSGTP